MAYTQRSSVTFDQTAYNRATAFALRAQLFYDRFATVRAAKQAMPGTAVVFHITDDLAEATTALTETVDVTAVAMSNQDVTLTLAEYGSAVTTTRHLRTTSHVPFDPIVANVIARNAAQSFDTLAKTQLEAGANARYAGAATSRATVAAGHTLALANVRRAVADLRTANAPEFEGNAFAGVIHPHVSYDLRAETGAAAWNDPVNYSDATRRWNGEVGKIEGVRFVESSRAPLFPDAGSPSTVDVYGTLIIGDECLAKAFAITGDTPGGMPEVVLSPTTDLLNRFHSMGWYWIGAFGRFREGCLRRIESSSSIGVNA